MRCITHFEFFIFLVWVLVWGGKGLQEQGMDMKGQKKNGTGYMELNSGKKNQ